MRRDDLPFAWWLLRDPTWWTPAAYLAAWFAPYKTLIRGRPWEDTQ